VKIKTVATLPKCDICGEEAKYDVPTTKGRKWANLCEKHYKIYGTKDAFIMGTQFKKRIPTTTNADQEIKEAVLLTSMEDMVFDGMAELECPSCGESRSLEPDFSGKFTCEGCGQKLKFNNPLY